MSLIEQVLKGIACYRTEVGSDPAEIRVTQQQYKAIQDEMTLTMVLTHGNAQPDGEMSIEGIPIRATSTAT